MHFSPTVASLYELRKILHLCYLHFGSLNPTVVTSSLVMGSSWENETEHNTLFKPACVKYTQKIILFPLLYISIKSSNPKHILKAFLTYLCVTTYDVFFGEQQVRPKGQLLYTHVQIRASRLIIAIKIQLK